MGNIMYRIHQDNRTMRIKYLKKLIANKKAALRHAPTGIIRTRMENDHVYYYYSSSSNSPRQYLSITNKKDMDLAAAIAQRGYDEKVLRLAVKELNLLAKEEAFYQTACADDIYDTLSPGRQALVTPIRTPDFTVLNIKKRQIYLWEHWGSCDKPEYMNDNIKKLVEYENAGYRIGENMIVTFETKLYPLTPGRIREVIEHYLM